MGAAMMGGERTVGSHVSQRAVAHRQQGCKRQVKFDEAILRSVLVPRNQMHHIHLRWEGVEEAM